MKNRPKMSDDLQSMAESVETLNDMPLMARATAAGPILQELTNAVWAMAIRLEDLEENEGQ